MIAKIRRDDLQRPEAFGRALRPSQRSLRVRAISVGACLVIVEKDPMG